MTKFTLLCIYHFATSIASTAHKLAGESPAEEIPGTETPAAEPTTTKRRGRPTNTGPETPPVEAAKETVAGKPESELRELIKPLVEDGRGEEVKKLIAKHGGTKLSDLPAAAHAAFIRDIEGLTI